MKAITDRVVGIVLLISLGIAACGGGPSVPSEGIDGTGDLRDGLTFGVITGFGSVIVNSIRYNSDNARITLDGEVGTEADLSIGHVVLVTGTIDATGQTGTAQTILFDDNVEGPISSIDVGVNSFVVLGQTVKLTAETSIDESSSPPILGFAIGDIVEVSGLVDSDRQIIATRVERRIPGGPLEITGVVSMLDVSRNSFNINAQVVDYSSAVLRGFPSGSIRDGDLVEVKGTDVGPGGKLAATEIIAQAANFNAAEGQHVQIAGVVTRFVSITDFDLSGFPITTDGSTQYLNATPSNVEINIPFEIEGEFVNGRLLADVIFRQRFAAAGTLHFEPNGGLDGVGLLTDHGSTAPGPMFDYSLRVGFPGCNRSPEPELSGEWFIDSDRRRVQSTLIHTATSDDLVIDIVKANQFDGCFGATAVDNGRLELSIRPIAGGAMDACEAQLVWDFDHSISSEGSVQYFTMDSSGFKPLVPGWDQCIKPNEGRSIQILADFDFFRNTVEGTVTTEEYLDTVAMNFFVVFHTCPGGTGC